MTLPLSSLVFQAGWPENPSHVTLRITQKFLTASAAALFLSVSAQAEVYRYVDSNGVWHFSSVATDRRYAAINRRRPIRVAPTVDTYDPLIVSAARAHGLPPALVKAVVVAESAFNPVAVSHKGAMGLMQLMPMTAQEMGVREPFQAASNLHGGSRYLRKMHDRYGSWNHALAACNAGPTAVDRYRGIPPFPETRTYVKRVLTYYRQFHGDFAR
jgi:soluble lytic murein transglycosylase-like protein